MNNLRQNFQHAQWGSIIGYEADIRLAVLRDEVELWQKRGTRNMWLRDTLKERVKELERKLFIKESERRERDKL